MFKIKFLISLSILVIFLAITSVIKNKTRVIEKKILNLNIKISQKKNNINEAQLDYDYLSSPSEIEKKLNEIGFDNYRPIKHSNIFFNVYDFNKLQKKTSNLKDLNEKKIKK